MKERRELCVEVMADLMASGMVENLNKNVMDDHIEFVELGIRGKDDDYYRALRIRDENKPGEIFLHLSPIIERAINTAVILHRNQYRKNPGRKIPYISHPLSVAEIVARYTDDSSAIVAAVLHDTVEDCDYTPEELEKDFGPEIAGIVMEVTENMELKKELGSKASWEDRKIQYLQHLKTASDSALIVSAADKIHNLNSMIEAYQEAGEKFWEQFNSPIDKQLWFYEEVLKVLQERLDNEIVNELAKTYSKAKEKLEGTGGSQK